jgi:putative ABC transport system permease protein
MMVNWKFAWREARHRPSRAILTLLSIVIGVAAVVAVTIASGTSRQAFNQIYQTVAGKASLVASGAIGSSFDENIADEVRKIPGVAAVAPLIKRNTVLYVRAKPAETPATDDKSVKSDATAKVEKGAASDNTAKANSTAKADKTPNGAAAATSPKAMGKVEKQYRLVALGIDPKYDQVVRDYEIVAGKRLRRLEKPVKGQATKAPPPSPDEGDGILLEEDFARNAGLKLDDKVQLLTRSGLLATNVIGFYKVRGASSIAEGSPVLMPLLAAQHFFMAPGKIDSAQIMLEPNANEESVQEPIAKLLPTGVTVHAPESRSPIAEETSKSTEQGMRIARAFSLLVAVFIIANTFLINVTQRRKQFGIMRAIGATRPQIAGIVYREAILMGVIGTILGSAVGVLASHYLTKAMGSLYQATLPSIDFTQPPFLIGTWHQISSVKSALLFGIQDPFVLGTLCGLGVSVLAAALPSWKASHLSPLEAMRDVLAEELEGVSTLMVSAGAAATAAGLGVMFAAMRGWVPTLYSVVGAALIMIGLVLMLPLALGAFSALVSALMRFLAPVESKLARLQLLRHQSRTALTVGVVFIAAAAGLSLANSIMDTVQDVQNWYEKAIRADFTVRAESPSMATGQAADLPDNVGTEIRKVSGIKSVDALRFRPLEASGQRANLIGRDHSSPEAPDFDIKSGDLDTLRQRLKEGAVAIGSVLAERAKLKVGDEMDLESVNGPQKFPVAAIVNDYQNGGLTIHMEREVARKRLGLEGIDAYVIKVDPAQRENAHKELKEIADRYGLLLQSYADIRRTIDVMMSGVVASLWSLVVLLPLVSGVGVINTLTINVLEQTREIGLLRIVAMTCNQVRKTIFTQATIIAVMALVPGLLAGVAIAYLFNLAMPQVTGHVVDFTLHPWLLVGGFVVGLIVISLAAWFPANRASKLDLPTALRTM